MEVYEPGTDHFSAEYLDYLATLTYETHEHGVVFAAGVPIEGLLRLSRDPLGRVVRVQVWQESDGKCAYFDFPQKGWMQP